jgi:dUTP pyrophosphatase
MVLKIFLSPSIENIENDDDSLNNFEKIYKEAIEKHNDMVINGDYPDAGFDLFNPRDITCNEGDITKVDLNIRCSAKVLTDSWKNYYSGYYLYPRSSIVKTPLRMSNCTGIIDSGYRNNILAVFDNIKTSPYFIEKYTRLVQICGPELCPIYVVMVNSFEELSEETERGLGGFGSTGYGIEYFNLNTDNDTNINLKIFNELHSLNNDPDLYYNYNVNNADNANNEDDTDEGEDYLETTNNSCVVVEDIEHIPDMDDDDESRESDDLNDDEDV